MSNMFENAKSFNQPIENWVSQKVIEEEVVLRDKNEFPNEEINNQKELDHAQDKVDNLTKSIESDPNDANLFFNRGYYKQILSDFKGAISDYSKTLEINPIDAEAYENRAVCKSKLFYYNEALIDITKSIEINPDNAQHYWNSSIIKAGLRDFKGALADHAVASKLNPEYTKAAHLPSNIGGV